MHVRHAPLLAAAMLLPLFASAARFPDVPATYPYGTAIQKLTDAGVIGGNPDGTFRPGDPVNRAAMLKMLYIASKKTPEKVGGCFSDVLEGSWYESYVCDASTHGYVQGYDGGVFKPGQPVTRAEALKLALVIFGIPEADINLAVDMYADVKAGDWFARHVHTALARKVLPLLKDGSPAAATAGTLLLPNQIIDRGEAAAIVWSASRAQLLAPASSVSSSSVNPAAQSDTEKRAAAALRVIAQEEAALARVKANTKSVSVPFADQGTFDGRQTFSYEFTVTASQQVVDIIASINDWNSGSLTCRLYHLGRSGFSQEYYLGFKDGKNCMIRVALSPGSWRLELQPEQLAPKFSVAIKEATGDGNDGFVQAGVLPIGNVRTGDLTTGDLEDWYTFSVLKDPRAVEQGKDLAVMLSSTDQLGCVIYSLDDVDQYGFVGPECGKRYHYGPGTYMISVRHGLPLGVRQSYSIQVK